MDISNIFAFALILITVIEDVNTEATFNFEPFLTESIDEETVKLCTALECPYNPGCTSDETRLFANCRSRIFRTATKQCPKLLEELGTLTYKGYSDLQFDYCVNENSKLREDMDELISIDCWKDIISCVAPLHELNETMHDEHVEEDTKQLCRNIMKLLEHCDMNFLYECKGVYQKFRQWQHQLRNRKWKWKCPNHTNRKCPNHTNRKCRNHTSATNTLMFLFLLSTI